MLEILRRREILHLRSVFPLGGWGGGGVRKLNIFGGMKILWIFFGDHHKIGIYLEVITMNFRVFSEGQGTDWRIFLGCSNFKYLFGVLEILDFFFFFFFLGGGCRCWARAYI